MKGYKMNAISGFSEHSLSYSSFEKLAPAAHAALLTMSKSVDEAGLEKTLTEIIKIRISQINCCAFCNGLHLNAARRVGVDEAKLDFVSVWRDSTVFSDRERAALLWAEHVTYSPTAPVIESEMNAIKAVFSETEIVHLTVAIANINAWNRIAGALHFSRGRQQSRCPDGFKI